MTVYVLRQGLHADWSWFPQHNLSMQFRRIQLSLYPDPCSKDHVSMKRSAAQVERLQRKFATIHSTLAQQQTQKPAEPPLSPLRSSVPSSINVAESFPKVQKSDSVKAWDPADVRHDKT